MVNTLLFIKMESFMSIKYTRLICALLLSFSFVMTIAQKNSPHEILSVDNHLKLNWISVDSTLQLNNQWICFRKEINIESKVKKAPMIIAVDSKYWLWINGELVIFEGGLKKVLILMIHIMMR